MLQNKKFMSIFTARGDGPFFQNKRFKRMIYAEAAMPLLTTVLGGIASYFYSSAGKYFAQGLEEAYGRAENLCRIFYNCAMGYGIGLCAVIAMVGIVSFVIMLVHLFRATKEKYSVARPLFLFVWSGVCILETFILMVLVIGFTYGQGI